MKKFIFALILAAIIIVSANVLSYLDRAEWADNPVSIVIQMHDDGWCKIFIDGVKMNGNYEVKYFPKVSTSVAYCNLPRNPLFRSRVNARIPYNASDMEIPNNASPEQVVVRSSAEQARTLSFIGRGIGNSAGLLRSVFYGFIEYTLVFNVGVDGKQHVVVGSANRTYSWDL